MVKIIMTHDIRVAYSRDAVPSTGSEIILQVGEQSRISWGYTKNLFYVILYKVCIGHCKAFVKYVLLQDVVYHCVRNLIIGIQKKTGRSMLQILRTTVVK